MGRHKTRNDARYKKLGAKLAAARGQADLTAAEVGERIGISRQGYSAYESGTSAPPPDKWVPLMEILGVPVAVFLNILAPDAFRLLVPDNSQLYSSPSEIDILEQGAKEESKTSTSERSCWPIPEIADRVAQLTDLEVGEINRRVKDVLSELESARNRAPESDTSPK